MIWILSSNSLRKCMKSGVLGRVKRYILYSEFNIVFWLKTSCYSRKCLLFLFWKVQSEFFHWRRGMWFLFRPFIESWLVLEQIGPKYYSCKCECLTLTFQILILCLWMFLTYCVACCGTISSKMWFKGGQRERPTSNDRHSTAETECTFNINLQVVWHFSGLR